MIDAAGWFDFARREPGPPDKSYTEACASRGVIFHSMVGFMAGWRSRLFDLSKLPDGRYTPNAAASVTGSILYSGELLQHYPIHVSCWAAGSRIPNTSFNSFEVEGGPPGNERELWRPAQTATAIRVVRDLAARKGWIPTRPNSPTDGTASLYEHNEATRWGSLFTLCPSGRNDWTVILKDWWGNTMPTPEDQLKVIRVLQPSLTACDLDTLLARTAWLYKLAGKPWPQP